MEQITNNTPWQLVGMRAVRVRYGDAEIGTNIKLWERKRKVTYQVKADTMKLRDVRCTWNFHLIPSRQQVFSLELLSQGVPKARVGVWKEFREDKSVVSSWQLLLRGVLFRFVGRFRLRGHSCWESTEVTSERHTFVSDQTFKIWAFLHHLVFQSL